MEHALDEVKAAVKQLLSKLRPGDAATLVGFNDTMFIAAEREKDRRGARAGRRSADARGAARRSTTRRSGARSGEPGVGPQGHRHLLGRRRSQQPDLARSGDRARAGQRRDALHRRLRRRRDRAGAAQQPRDLRAGHRRPRVLSAARRRSSTACSTRSSRSWPISTCCRIPRPTRSRTTRWREIKVRVQKGNYDIRARQDTGQPDPAGGEVIMRQRIGVSPSSSAVVAATVLSARRRAAAVGAAGRRRSDAVIPERRRGGHRRRRRRRQAGAAGARPDAADFTVTVAGQAAAGRHRGVRRRAPAPPPAGARRPRRCARQHQRRRRHRPAVRVRRRSEHARTGQRAPRRRRRPRRSSSRLSFADRSALMLLPLGPNVDVHLGARPGRDGLQRVTGPGGRSTAWEYGSLTEARDIANRNQIALRTVGERECGGGAASGSESAPASPAPRGAGGADDRRRRGGRRLAAARGGAAAAGPAAPAARRRPAERGGGGWRGARAARRRLSGFGRTVLARHADAGRVGVADGADEVAGQHHVAAPDAGALARVRGDKTVVLISGGWPLDERDEISHHAHRRREAAAARATVFTVFVPPTSFSADRRMMTIDAAGRRSYLYSGPLETLAAHDRRRVVPRRSRARKRPSSGSGASCPATTASASRRIPSDADGKGAADEGAGLARRRHRPRARDLRRADLRGSRLGGAPRRCARGPGAGDRSRPARHELSLRGSRRTRRAVRLLVTGEASRAQPGDGDAPGAGQRPGRQEGRWPARSSSPNGGGDMLPFSTNVAVPPGSYIVRVGVMDGAGRVGSVDHRVDAQDVPLGALSATGPLLVRVPAGTSARAAPRAGRRPAGRTAGARDRSRQGEATGSPARCRVRDRRRRPTAGTAPRAGRALARPAGRRGARAGGRRHARACRPATYVVRAKVTSGERDRRRGAPRVHGSRGGARRQRGSARLRRRPAETSHGPRTRTASRMPVRDRAAVRPRPRARAAGPRPVPRSRRRAARRLRRRRCASCSNARAPRACPAWSISDAVAAQRRRRRSSRA